MEKNQKVSVLRASYPDFAMSKSQNILVKGNGCGFDFQKIERKFSKNNIITIDGVKISFESSWVHLRKSNTEAIIRVYTEAKSQLEADELAQRFLGEIQEVI